MSIYEFSLRQEVLLERGADILGSLFRYKQKKGIIDKNDPVSIMYSLVWKAKQDILRAKTVDDLIGIDSKFDMASRFASDPVS